jgi:hypothetical protein
MPQARPSEAGLSGERLQEVVYVNDAVFICCILYIRYEIVCFLDPIVKPMFLIYTSNCFLSVFPVA